MRFRIIDSISVYFLLLQEAEMSSQPPHHAKPSRLFVYTRISWPIAWPSALRFSVFPPASIHQGEGT